jgi:hypothetical protein
MLNRVENGNRERPSDVALCGSVVILIVVVFAFSLTKELVGERGQFDEALWILRQRIA